MKELLVLLRAMQLFSQNAHHLVKGMTFQQDHGFFGDTYEAVADDYDSVAERIIGLYGEEHLQLQPILTAVVAKLVGAPSTPTENNKVFYEYQLQMEEALCALTDKIIQAGVSPGVEQLVGEICNTSQMRQYKIKQRLK